ncbi:hypothetical protein DSL72_006028 [Monilinia vaccinii-corymbosi]|uniref:NUC153 domain-containing protein n=1 Tax=Monilinia vaccinii-corymbosi TaxID=61207 RepID=A0A8A3PHI3_9HELO|nr:hypothetical protein DSL72_006028 [Monilinia vaccinii-corymbosi]
MPKQKIPEGASKDVSSASEINDPRFSNFSTDPRFRLPSKKQTRTKIDKRFSRMLKDDDFSNSAKVDRYGRKLSGSGKKKALERLYVDEDEDEEDEDSESEKGEDVEVEDDEVVERELRKAAAGYDPARGGGFSSSEDEDEDEDGGVDIEEEATFPDMQAEQQAVEMGEVSSRIAVVNLDWDNIRSVDLMAVFQSFLQPGGKIHKISIYQSEYGKERMEREELEGPPKEIFAKKEEEGEEDEDEEDSEDDEETDDEELEEKIKKDLQKGDDGNEFDSAALRQYQLERLRYFYAVVVCSDEKTAENIYQKCDGTEYLSSANFFDLRFIPDGTEFDDKPRDECTQVPTGYKPTDFVTDALQHSKVKLTWDMNPEEASRKDAINRAFTGSRAEIGENDLRAYLGSDSEDDEEEEEAAEDDVPKLSKKELERQKLRAALGLGDEPTKKKKDIGPVGDMEVTFTAGLSTTTRGNVFENEPIRNETTAEAYIRKEKERKARRKEKAKAVREGKDPNAPENEDVVEVKEDLGFDDPFFATDEATKSKAAKSLRKEERKKKHEAKAKEAEEKASNRAELELLMQDNSTDKAEHLDHFDIAEIQRAEKAKKKKGKGKGKKGEESESKRGGLQENFQMDVGDERFQDVFKNHEYAIDPSNPKFKGTEGMKKLLEEGRRKRGGEDDGEVEVKSTNKKRKTQGEGEGEKSRKADLGSLVEAVKKKSKLAK